MIEKLTIISILTSVTTEAVKKILDRTNFKYSSDALAGLLSVLMTAGIEIYIFISKGAGNATQMLSEGISLAFLSFLGATLGYDKMLQTLAQLKEHDLD